MQCVDVVAMFRERMQTDATTTSLETAGIPLVNSAYRNAKMSRALPGARCPSANADYADKHADDGKKKVNA